MAVCSKCGKTIKEESAFCPYCGTTVEKTAVKPPEKTESNKEDARIEKKQISKKTIIIGIVVAVIIAALGSVGICEAKIAKAKRLYVQSEYFKAYREVENIPSLGREELIRIKVAWIAGDNYQDYLVTKRIRLSSTSRKFNNAYQDAFWELTFGLFIDLREINREPCELNDIELDEYQKFIDLYYSELSSMFHMSKDEADKLVARYNKLDLDNMKAAANDWLYKNFF